MDEEDNFQGCRCRHHHAFTEDGVNFAELSRIIEDQIKGGTDAIVITGTSGESATMTDEEHRAAIKCAVDTVKGRIPVIAGTGSNETSYAIELSKYAEEVGADAVLVVTPYYNKCTQKGLIAHYKAIADSINIPIVLYDVPSRTGVGIQIPTYVELAKIPNIVAVKEANGDLSKILRLRAACGDSLDVYSGNDDQIVPILSLGGKGVISVAANVVPREMHELTQLCLENRFLEAGTLQLKLHELIRALFCEVNPIPVKAAMELLGLCSGELRLPLCRMSERHLEQLSSALKPFRSSV